MDSDVVVTVVIVIILVLVTLFVITKIKQISCSKCKSNEKPLVLIGDHIFKTTSIAPGKSETLPAFLRNDGRIIVTASPPTENMSFPTNYDTREVFKGWMTPVMDQGACGSCWAFSSCGVFGDRIKIATRCKDLFAGDFISQFHLAACMKCGPNGTNKVCDTVCSGHYMDEVLQYLKTSGAYANSAISRATNNGTQYICYSPTASQSPKLYKASQSYRVNPYAMGELSNIEKRAKNEYAIMYDLFKYGPVTATIKVFDPVGASELHKNFYLYTKGIYGTNWDRDPASSDGYHAIAIVGWGEELVQNVPVKYWIIRNSWGTSWGQNGYGKIIRGVNRAIIESDIWSMQYQG